MNYSDKKEFFFPKGTSMKYLYVFFFTLAITAFTVHAQNFVFTILGVKGQVTCSKAGSDKWVKVSTGDKIFSGQRLQLAGDAYAGLVHASGAVLELSGEGKYTTGELSELLKKNKTSVAKKFSDYVIKEVSAYNSSSKEMRSMGAVQREVFEKFDLRFPADTYLLGDEVIISWYPNAKVKEYVFELFNSKGGNILSKKITESAIIVNFADLHLEKGKAYTWSVKASGISGMNSGECSFFLVSQEKENEIMDTANEMSDSTTADSPIHLLMLGSFYDQQQLKYNAMKCYQNALDLAPDVESYRDLYLNFLEKNNLNRMMSRL